MNPENRYLLRGRPGDHPASSRTKGVALTQPTPTTTDMATVSTAAEAGPTTTVTSTPSVLTPAIVPPTMSSIPSAPPVPGPIIPPSAPRHQLEPFSGVNQDPVRWLTWYDRYCVYYHLTTDQQKLSDFPFHLREHAKAWFDSVPIPATFAQLRTLFQERFQSRSMDFMTITQAPSESVQDYFLKLCKCRPNNLDDEWVKGIAIRGLRDNIRTIVMPQNPSSFEDARRMALLAEETLSMTTQTPVAACQPSQFEAVVLQQLNNLKLEIEEMRRERALQNSRPSPSAYPDSRNKGDQQSRPNHGSYRRNRNYRGGKQFPSTRDGYHVHNR